MPPVIRLAEQFIFTLHRHNIDNELPLSFWI